jgi:hypothetical protein
MDNLSCAVRADIDNTATPTWPPRQIADPVIVRQTPTGQRAVPTEPPIRTSVRPGKSSFMLRDKTPDKGDLLSWQWVGGAATPKSDYGDPLGTDDYALCVYDDGALIMSASADAGGLCGKKPCWKDKKKGFVYTDKLLTPTGLKKLTLVEGVTDGKTKIVVAGKGIPLLMPDLSAIIGPVDVQLQRSGGGRASLDLQRPLQEERRHDLRTRPTDRGAPRRAACCSATRAARRAALRLRGPRRSRARHDRCSLPAPGRGPADRARQEANMEKPLRMMSAIEDREDADYEDMDPSDKPRWGGAPSFDGEIPRKETVHRIALTLLFAIIAGAMRTVLALIVVFELLFTLITRRPPGTRVRELANRISTYYYRLLRYLTYNESRVPFPFSDFPEPLEPDAFRVEDRDSEVLCEPPDPEEPR